MAQEELTNMANIMSEAIEKMVQFRVDALSPDMFADQLPASRSVIRGLQQQLLKINPPAGIL
jgi:hypothetical protein